MTNENTKQLALEILEKEHIGVMVTNQNGKPIAKYMTFQNEGFDLYTLIPQETLAKIKSLKYYTHILLGYENDHLFDTFIEYEGTFKQSDHLEMAAKLHDLYPISAADNFTLLHIIPTRIRIMNKAGKNQDEIVFNSSH